MSQGQIVSGPAPAPPFAPNSADTIPIRRSRWPMVVLGMLLLVLGTLLAIGLFGWFVVRPHLQATAYIGTLGGSVDWEADANNWRQGGRTVARMSQNYYRWSENRVNDADLAHLLLLVRVEELDLAGSDRITDAGLDTIARLPHLKSLRLSRLTFGTNPPMGPLITDASLPRLRPLRGLTELQLDGSRVTDAGVALIVEAFPDLEYLDLGGSAITDASLVEIKKLKHLKYLFLELTKIDPKRAEALRSDLKQLSTIEVGPLQIRKDHKDRP